MPRLSCTPGYAIYGNTFEQRSISRAGTPEQRVKIVKRYLVSTEFVQLFYKLSDGEFDQELFNELSDNEKLLLSRMASYLSLPVPRNFNIAMSKYMKAQFERLRFIEAAVKSGNLSTELKVEYYGIIDKLIAAGMIKKHLGSYQKGMMNNTPINQ